MEKEAKESETVMRARSIRRVQSKGERLLTGGSVGQVLRRLSKVVQCIRNDLLY
jgi:hypothetical protein